MLVLPRPGIKCPLSKLFLRVIQLAALIPGLIFASPTSRIPTLSAPSFFAQCGQSTLEDGYDEYDQIRKHMCARVVKSSP